MCQLGEDPIQRTIFIDVFPTWHGRLADLADVVEKNTPEKDFPLLSALCLGTGGIAKSDVPEDDFREWTLRFVRWHRQHPDGSVHNATGWALRQWNAEPRLEASEPSVERGWFINEVGLTLVNIPAGEFRRRDEDVKEGPWQDVTLTKPFFLSDREISLGDFRKFVDEKQVDCPSGARIVNWEKTDVGIRSPTGKHPVQNVSWYGAANYCNWLSWKAGIPEDQWCYIELDKAKEAGRMKVRAGFQQLHGYRLPTEAEWEYACSARTTTMWSCGDDESLLPRYAVYQRHQTDVCGARLPNGWGLFDMQGNVWEWCTDGYGKYGEEAKVPDPPGLAEAAPRVLRGGGWDCGGRDCRSAFRYGSDPGLRYLGFGFRVVLGRSDAS
ncbi:MAG: formylglycine-generating enzyme family protein [Planctomycetota bacterium]|nr:formylglycine-generating enzyme family protein [Planctomycetota bacterium]